MGTRGRAERRPGRSRRRRAGWGGGSDRSGPSPRRGDRTRVRPVPGPPLSLSPFFPKRGLPDVGSVSPRSRPAGGASLFSFGSAEEGGGETGRTGDPVWSPVEDEAPTRRWESRARPTDRPTARDGGGRARRASGGLPKRGFLFFSSRPSGLFPEEKGGEEKTVMILPQVHLRKPCYDFYFL